MKILIFSYKFHPDVGGIESISKMLADYFFRQGHEVHLITKTKSSKASGFSFTVIRNPGLSATIKELQWADIVFENNPCFSMSYPNFFIRKPSVITLQTWLETLSGKYDTRQRFKHTLLKSASAVIACSNAMRTTFAEAIVIPNPYDDNLFKINTDIQRTKDFVFLGRLVSDKGADIAIHALNKIVQDYPTAMLTIIGNGEEMPALKILASNLKLQSHIDFKGILEGDDLVNCLNEHKYIVVPSVWKEPFGIVALEGIACGCIPIVSDGGGLPEAAGNIGCVFQRGDVEGLIKCMQQMLEHTSFSLLSEASKKHLQSHAISVTGERYLQVFKSVLNKH
jgi:glycosyltransferase involved in cell wall biosynthesis